VRYQVGPEIAIATGPFLLERYEPNVKTVFKHNPNSFLTEQTVGGVQWLVLDDESTELALCRNGQLDCGLWHWWAVRRQDVEALKKTQEMARNYFLPWHSDLPLRVFWDTGKSGTPLHPEPCSTGYGQDSRAE
jgi:hypothetical protein